ncbi:MAG TPA: ATP-grasp domain-containing protein, partial [Sphingomonadales bacterium]|nr:ATP-grasp domain-containing protein [Sphingomonadales bacterium]
MNIHEHQAKALLKTFDLPVLKGKVAFTADEALKAAEKLGGPVWVLKAQIHAGGRGKAGGVKVVKTLEDLKTAAKGLLGKTLVTHQTGPKGKEVRRLYIEDGCRIAKEFYLSLLLDRAKSRVAVMASAEGGMDIEEVAEKHPEKIIQFAIDPKAGVSKDQKEKLAQGLGLEGRAFEEAGQILDNLYRAYVKLDATLIEINPLVLTEAGHL